MSWNRTYGTSKALFMNNCFVKNPFLSVLVTLHAICSFFHHCLTSMPQRLPTPTLPGIFTPAPPPPIAPAGARSRDWGDDSQTRCCAPLLSLLSPSLFSLRSPSLSCSPFSHPGFLSPPHPHPFPLCGTADGCLGSRSRHPLQPRAEQATLRANSWLVFFRIISWS